MKENFTCKKCGLREPEIKLTVDHIIPVSRWSDYIINHQEIKYSCNDIDNIQPFCLKCNLSKHAKIDGE